MFSGVRTDVVIGPYSQGIEPLYKVPYERRVVMTEEEWAEKAHEIAIEIVMTVNWPWTDRQKRLWYVGILAGIYNRKALEDATMAELQEWHRDLTH